MDVRLQDCAGLQLELHAEEEVETIAAHQPIAGACQGPDAGRGELGGCRRMWCSPSQHAAQRNSDCHPTGAARRAACTASLPPRMPVQLGTGADACRRLPCPAAHQQKGNVGERHAQRVLARYHPELASREDERPARTRGWGGGGGGGGPNHGKGPRACTAASNWAVPEAGSGPNGAREPILHCALFRAQG
jgi:hypothetical protein